MFFKCFLNKRFLLKMVIVRKGAEKSESESEGGWGGKGGNRRR